MVRSLSRGLEQLDWIAVRILQLDLFAARTDFHLVAQAEPCSLERLDASGHISHAKDKSIPAA